MTEQLRREVPNVEPEHRPIAHRHEPPRRGVQVTVVAQGDLPDGVQPAAKIRVFAVELDGRVESADRLERLAPDREVAAVEDRADAAARASPAAAWPARP